jgi:hypothetical protein
VWGRLVGHTHVGKTGGTCTRGEDWWDIHVWGRLVGHTGAGNAGWAHMCLKEVCKKFCLGIPGKITAWMIWVI